MDLFKSGHFWSRKIYIYIYDKQKSHQITIKFGTLIQKYWVIIFCFQNEKKETNVGVHFGSPTQNMIFEGTQVKKFFFLKKKNCDQMTIAQW